MFRSLPEAFEVSELFSALLFDVNSRTAHLRPPFLGVPCASPPPCMGEMGAGGDVPDVPVQRWSPGSAPSRHKRCLGDFASNH